MLHRPFPLASIFLPKLTLLSKSVMSKEVLCCLAVMAAVNPAAPAPMIAIFKFALCSKLYDYTLFRVIPPLKGIWHATCTVVFTLYKGKA